MTGVRFRAREWLARSWIVIPAAYVVGALALGALVPRIEAGDESLLGRRLADEAAQDILAAIAGGMIAFIGIVVSVAVLVVQFGAGQYTPRLVHRFRRDPVVKHALGAFVAPALYAVVSLREVGRTGESLDPNLTVAVGLLLLLLAVFAFFVFMGRLLDLMRPRKLYAQLTRAGERAIDDVYPAPLADGEETALEALPPVTRSVAWEGPSGVLTALDRPRLTAAAAAADMVIEVVPPLGGFIRSGGPLLLIRGEGSLGPESELAAGAIIAEERTITQDPAFAFRTIVDIALKSLSPAVNDPTTGVQALDSIEALLHRLAERRLDVGQVRDGSGQVRLVYPVEGWEEFLDLGLTEIRRYGADAPQIARRMRAVLTCLLEQTPPVRHAAVRQQVGLLDSSIEHAYPDAEERAHAAVPDRLGIGGHVRSF